MPAFGRSNQEIFELNQNEAIKQGWLGSSADEMCSSNMLLGTNYLDE